MKPVEKKLTYNFINQSQTIGTIEGLIVHRTHTHTGIYLLVPL